MGRPRMRAVSMAKAWLFVYQLPAGTANRERVQFSHRLLGARTTSHGGRYEFFREGLLTDRPHLRPINGVVVVGAGDRAAVERFLREHGALVLMREIVALPEDLRALGLG